MARLGRKAKGFCTVGEVLPRPVLFLDFDGTISRRDVVDLILETYADDHWRAVEDEWCAGGIGSRECLRAQIGLVRATPKQIDELMEAVEIDEGLLALLETCRRKDITACVVSDGFDYCIERLFRRWACSLEVARTLHGLGVYASHLEPAASGRWQTDFPHPKRPCAHGCATCKPLVMRGLSRPASVNVFVGDGLSDRYAAAAAPVVFAKQGLALYCAEQGIAYTPYETLADVATWLEKAISDFEDQGQLVYAGLPSLTKEPSG